MTTGDRPDHLRHARSSCVQRDADRLHGFCGNGLTFVYQVQEDVFSADGVVLELACLALSQEEDPPGSVGEQLEHVSNDRLQTTVDAWRFALDGEELLDEPGPDAFATK